MRIEGAGAPKRKLRQGDQVPSRAGGGPLNYFIDCTCATNWSMAISVPW
jgi:hypothetical protein